MTADVPSVVVPTWVTVSDSVSVAFSVVVAVVFALTDSDSVLFGVLDVSVPDVKSVSVDVPAIVCVSLPNS
jgi:hypothetical protein